MTSWNSGPNLVLQKLLNNQRAFPRAIRPVYLPVQSGISIVDHFYRMGGETSEEGGFSFVYFSRIS
jgi:hypothetical protein